MRTIRRVTTPRRRRAAGRADATIETVEYSDGFGRLVQTRTPGRGRAVRRPGFGGGVLPRDQDDPATGERSPVADADGRPARTSSSAAGRCYDNKGRVVEQLRAVLRHRLGLRRRPATPQLGAADHDPLRPARPVVRTVNPDGTEQRSSTACRPPRDPDVFTPTPWETYTYDANDNAGRTHPARPAAYEHHWDTPTSTVVDALGRTVGGIVRHAAAPARRPRAGRAAHPVRYDIQGNLVAVTDPLGREAFRYRLRPGRPALRTESIDAGVRRTVLDAAGNAIERRDGKGALILHGARPRCGRPVRLWARDDAAAAGDPARAPRYGDGGDPASRRRAGRGPGRQPARPRCTATTTRPAWLTFDAYDFKGNVLDQTRQVIADEPSGRLPGPADPAAAGDRPFRVDWQPPAGTSLAAARRRLLEPTGTAPRRAFDALNRVTACADPADVDGGRRELRPAVQPRRRAGAGDRRRRPSLRRAHRLRRRRASAPSSPSATA